MMNTADNKTWFSQPKNTTLRATTWLDPLSTQGRMGRFGYFVYSLTLPVLVFWVLAAIAGLLGKLGKSGEITAYGVLLLACLVSIFILVQLTVKRCHDFNASGWLTLLVIIPFAFFVLCLIPGNRQENPYGEPPEPPSTLLKIGALLLIVLIVATVTNVLLRLLFG